MEAQIQIFENEQFRIRYYVDKDGTIMFNAEDVARYLGFVEKEKISSSGEKYIRWQRFNRYVNEIKANSHSPLMEKFSTPLGKDDFIPENLVYRLAMKANNEKAEKFQAWIADEVAPSIRKHGYYISPNADIDFTAADTLSLKEKVEVLLRGAALTNLDRLRNQLIREAALIATGKKMV